MDPTTKNVLLTGAPGCGKTTVILRLVDLLPDLQLAGFCTQELRDRGQRAGFEAVGLSSGLRCVLAHIRSQLRVRVGRYGVEPDRLEPLVHAEVEKPLGEVSAFVIDEIGKMELHCKSFFRAVHDLFDDRTPVIATVALKGGGLIAGVKGRPDVRLMHVTEENRDHLPETLASWMRAVAKPRPGEYSS